MAAASCRKPQLGGCGLPPAADISQRKSTSDDRQSIAGVAPEVVERLSDSLDFRDNCRQVARQSAYGGGDSLAIAAFGRSLLGRRTGVLDALSLRFLSGAQVAASQLLDLARRTRAIIRENRLTGGQRTRGRLLLQ